MRRAEIDGNLRLYRNALEAYGVLCSLLEQIRAEAMDVPLLKWRQRLVRYLKEAQADLERIGDGISIIPELTERIQEEERVSGLLRAQFAKAGLRVRFDSSRPEEASWDEECRDEEG